jgi:hypothetical protein
MNYLEVIGSQLLGRVPYILAWGVAVVFAAVMERRSHGKAEKLLLAGTCLMLVVQIVAPVLQEIAPRFSGQGAYLITITYINAIITGIVSAAGIICLVYAYWVKFKMTNESRN